MTAVLQLNLTSNLSTKKISHEEPQEIAASCVAEGDVRKIHIVYSWMGICSIFIFFF